MQSSALIAPVRFIAAANLNTDRVCWIERLLPSFKGEEEFTSEVHRKATGIVSFLDHPPPAAVLALEPLTTEHTRRSATADRVSAFART